MLSYETDTPLDDMSALHQEVDELWEKFRFDAEEGNYIDAFIDANGKPIGSGPVTATHSYHFEFKRGSDGKWSRVN